MSAQAVLQYQEAHLTEVGISDVSSGRRWTSWILRGLATAFLLLDAVMKLVKPAAVVEATLKLGYPESMIVGIGSVLLICTVLYAVPRTAIWGAICLTGYLGGASASNVRAGTPLFNVVFPILFAILIWASLVLTNRRLESVLFKSE